MQRPEPDSDDSNSGVEERQANSGVDSVMTHASVRTVISTSGPAADLQLPVRLAGQGHLQLSRLP